MNWIDKFKSIFIVCLSISITFVCIEFSYRILKGLNKKSDFVNQTRLYESGNNFQNFQNFFKYYSNTSIRSTALFSKVKPTKLSDLIIEYDYIISTNNAGLVMQKDLKNAEEVIYIVGDSFTEGQGASPWFYKMEEFYNNTNVKLVNLGILGTGPKQWNNLENFITNQFNLAVKGSVINIIPSDMTREVWVFKKKEITCLVSRVCNYLGGFQGFDFEVNDNNYKIKKSLLDSFNNKIPKDNFKNFIKKSYVIVDIYRYIKNFLKAPIIKSNEEALLNLKRAAKNNVFVNLISQKPIDSKKFSNNNLSKNLIKFLEKNKFDFKWCHIPSNGFHKNDGHPNEKGYIILRKCTEDALKALQN